MADQRFLYNPEVDVIWDTELNREWTVSGIVGLANIQDTRINQYANQVVEAQVKIQSIVRELLEVKINVLKL